MIVTLEHNYKYLVTKEIYNTLKCMKKYFFKVFLNFSQLQLQAIRFHAQMSNSHLFEVLLGL